MSELENMQERFLLSWGNACASLYDEIMAPGGHNVLAIDNICAGVLRPDFKQKLFKHVMNVDGSTSHEAIVDR
eukprot:scaffold3141_cov105-Pinguiococcus_pyrenoidosus.AAC.1